jgi:hypothetical protein
MSIIRRFSLVVLSLTIHSYKEKESVHITVRIASIPSYLVIRLRVVEIDIVISTPVVIAYSLEASTTRVTLLYFVKLQCKMLLVRLNSPLLRTLLLRTTT